MSENKTTYESLDDKVAPEALLKDTRGKLQMVDGHGIKQEADYDDPDKLYGMLIAVFKSIIRLRMLLRSRRHIIWQKKRMETKRESRENRILSTHSG